MWISRHSQWLWLKDRRPDLGSRMLILSILFRPILGLIKLPIHRVLWSLPGGKTAGP